MRRFLVPLIAMLLLGALSSSPAVAGANKPRPFHATVESDFSVIGTCDDGSALQEITGTGRASHLGRFSILGTACTGESAEPDVVTWTAANGDTIIIPFDTVVGDIGPDGSASIELIPLDAIVSGTGRFQDVNLEGANLKGTVQFFDPSGSSGHIEAELIGGTITYDASDRSR